MSTLPLVHGGIIFNIYEWAGQKHFAFLQLECQSRGRTRDLRLSKQADLTDVSCNNLGNYF